MGDIKDIKALVDEYAKWDRLQKEAKVIIDGIKASLQEKAVAMMKDTKQKQVEFYGTGSNKAVITEADTVKLVSPTLFKQVLGDVFGDFIKEKTTFEATEPFKRVLQAILQGEFGESTLDDAIRQMEVDDNTSKLLKKKLKGNWEKDVATLMTVAGMTKERAEHFAYFVKEAIDFEKIVTILGAAGHKYNTPDFDISLTAIKHGAGVETSIKIGIEYDAEQAS